MMSNGLSNGLTIWLTGLPSAGKTTLGQALAGQLRTEGYRVEILDGDRMRRRLSRDLGLSRADRDENVRRVGYVAHLLSRNGVIAVCSLISPYQSTRDELRALHDGRFFEVYVSTPVSVCAERDVKGLYARQQSGQIVGLTGVDDPYEPPPSPHAVIPTHVQSIDESVAELRRVLPA